MMSHHPKSSRPSSRDAGFVTLDALRFVVVVSAAILALGGVFIATTQATAPNLDAHASLVAAQNAATETSALYAQDPTAVQAVTQKLTTPITVSETRVQPGATPGPPTAVSIAASPALKALAVTATTNGTTRTAMVPIVLRALPPNSTATAK